MIVAIPWYKSPQTISLLTTAVAAAVALFPKVGAALGLTSPGAISIAVQNIAGVIALVAPVIGTYFRAKSPEQPITLTQAAADTRPATLKAEQTEKINAQNAHTAYLVVAAQKRKEAAAAPAPPAVAVNPTKPWGK